MQTGRECRWPGSIPPGVVVPYRTGDPTRQAGSPGDGSLSWSRVAATGCSAWQAIRGVVAFEPATSRSATSEHRSTSLGRAAATPVLGGGVK